MFSCTTSGIATGLQYGKLGTDVRFCVWPRGLTLHSNKTDSGVHIAFYSEGSRN